MADHEQDGTNHPRCPYVVRNIIKLQLKTPFDGQTIDVKITKVFEPFTCSSAMVVRPVCPTTTWESDMVLKLFDRRFATEARKDDRLSPWTSDIEQNYHQFILDGHAAKLVAELTADKDLPDWNFGTWNSSQDETYLHDYIQGLYETEIEAYNILADIQGGILNEDVKTRNFVVQSCPENRFHVFMIDFALCNFREKYPGEDEWEECKSWQDEEGAVGFVMQKKLPGGFVYHRSARYKKLDEKYGMDG
ncbi:uncharacterized protein N7483_009833 [Penicillium malachiteum]|uniref:uncharacterized protein n=1 Tax=Penicillium malachiteum TaxID=1324776 RepID=UPI0025480EE2|nr:uncharacterized protein N7483_009833 [Penicillium malachiteum]KAJ5721899.1 hypothetical protein N7483_009833 [Penicillium malachiteum]